MDKQAIQEKLDVILGLLNQFCVEKLDDEYAALSEKLLKKLGRKRIVPFMTGKPEIWAAAIIHALGKINFLFDKSSEPYVSVTEINEYFGTKTSTTGNKSKEIRDMFKMGYWDNEFATSRMRDSDPFAQMVMIDGMILPLSMLPEEQQQIVKQARAEGIDIAFRTSK